LVFVLPLTIIHGFGNGRLGGGGDDDQVQPHLLRLAHGCRSRHNLDGTVGENGPHFSSANCLVDVFSDSGPARWEISWWIHAGLTDGADQRMKRGKGMDQMVLPN